MGLWKLWCEALGQKSNKSDQRIHYLDLDKYEKNKKLCNNIVIIIRTLLILQIITTNMFIITYIVGNWGWFD